MASTCYNLWRKYTDQKGNEKWMNEGAAPDGACPICFSTDYNTCPDGYWDGISTVCENGNLYKTVCDGMGWVRRGDLITENSQNCVQFNQ